MATQNFYPNHQLGFIDASVGQSASSFNNQYRRWTPSVLPCFHMISDGKNHRVSLVLDFYIPPDQQIDPTIYNVTSAKLKLFVHSTFGNTAQSSYQLYLRNDFSNSLYRVPLVQLANANTEMSGVYNSTTTSYMSGSTLNLAVSNWITLNLLSGFYSKFLTHQTGGFVSLVLKRTTRNSYDWFQAASQLYEDGSFAPTLEINYERKQEPATITNFDLKTPSALNYVEHVPTVITVRDPDQENQTLTVEGSAKLGDSNDYAPYTPLSLVESPVISALDKGTISERTVILPFRKGSLATPKRFKYHADVTRSAGASFSGNNLVLGSGAYAYSVLYTGLDLKPNTTYRFGITFTTNRYNPYISVNIPNTPFYQQKQVATYNENSGATYIDFNSGQIVRLGNGTIDGYQVTLRVDGATDSTITITGVTLIEIPYDTVPWKVRLRAKVNDTDGTSEYFVMPRELDVDGRAPTKPVITDENGSQHEVFTQSPSARFVWTESQVLGNVPMRQYRYRIDNDPNTIITSDNSTVIANRLLEHNFTWDDKHYLHVAGEAENNLIGETASYGYWYNVPATFNEVAGIKCNDIALKTDITEWINYELRPQFTWTAPAEANHLMRYEIQVGTSGGINAYTIEPFEIDWSFIPAGVGAFFRIQIHDATGILYLDKNTLYDKTGWDVYKANSFQWVSMATELEGLGRTNLPKTIIPDATSDPLYSLARYSISLPDHIPDEIPLYAQISVGYYDATSGNYVWSQFTQPKRFVFTQGSYASSALFSIAHTVPTDQYMSLLPQYSTDNFGLDIQQFPITDYYKSYAEVFRYSAYDRLMVTFKGNAVVNLVDSVAPSISGTSSATRSTGVYARSFSGTSYLNFSNRYNPNYSDLSLAFWFKAPVLSTARTIIAKGGGTNGSAGFYVSLDQNGKVLAYFGVNASQYALATTPSSFQDDTWHHCAVTIDRDSSIKIYIDGSLQVSANLNAKSKCAPSNNLYIGRTDAGSYFNGSLDDIVLTHRVLTLDEIRFLSRWVSDESPLGLERAITSKGVLGNNTPKVLRAYADRGISIDPGSYKYRYKKIVNGVIDPAWTTSAVSYVLPANASVAYSWTFEQPEINETGITVTSFRPSVNLSKLANTYYVRMRLFDGFEHSDWTRLYKFRINRKPNPPKNLFIQ